MGLLTSTTVKEDITHTIWYYSGAASTEPDVDNEYPPVFCVICGAELRTVRFVMRAGCACLNCNAWHRWRN